MLQNLDRAMLLWTSVSFSCYFLNILMPAFSVINDNGFIWLLLGALMLLDKKMRKAGWMMLLCIGLSYILGNLILKELVMRPRPFEQFGVSQLLISPPDDYSFPSGHTSSSFAAVTMLFLTKQKARTTAAIYALLISFSRVYLFVHFPSDVLLGAILGIACAYITFAMFACCKAPKQLYESIEIT